MYVCINIYSVRKREMHVDYYKNMDGHMWIAIQIWGQVAKKQKTSKGKKRQKAAKEKESKRKTRNSCQTVQFLTTERKPEQLPSMVQVTNHLGIFSFTKFFSLHV